MHVGAVSIYPLKSSRGVRVETAEVQRSGLADDRRWAVVDDSGAVVTARENDRLLHVKAAVDDGVLVLDGPRMDVLRVPVPVSGRTVAVGVSRMPEAVDAGAAAAAWLSAFLGDRVRLVWQDDPRRRPVSAPHGGVEGDHLSLADAGPILVTTTASLEQLNAWIAEDDPAAIVPMERFRPNVVVDGATEPFAEDAWQRIWIGDVEYRHGEICDRCVMTTIDPLSLVHGKEPIRTLARHRRWDGTTWFGVRLIPLSEGVVRVGDPVRGESCS